MNKPKISNQQIRSMWDQTNKDMPFPEFLRRIRRLQDPTTIAEDLGRLMTQRHEVNAINEALKSKGM